MPAASCATGRKEHIAEPHFHQNYEVVERMSATGVTTPPQDRQGPYTFRSINFWVDIDGTLSSVINGDDALFYMKCLVSL